MKRFSILILTTFLAGCAAPGSLADAHTPVDEPASTRSPSPTVSSAKAGSPGITPVLVESPIPLNVPDEECETHQVQLLLTPSTSSLQMGESLTLTATLTSSGCAMLGLPKYSLSLHTEGIASLLQPAEPEPVTHAIGLRDGEQDEAHFTLQAVAPGEVELQVTTSFEVHLGYPGPAYWATATSNRVRVEVDE